MALRGARVVQRLPCPSVRATAESVADVRGPITLGTKRTGKPGAGEPHAGFDEAGAGDGLTAGLEAFRRSDGLPDRQLISEWAILERPLSFRVAPQGTVLMPGPTHGP